MREKMDAMQHEFERFFEYLRTHANDFPRQAEQLAESEALIPISRLVLMQQTLRRENNDE
jgi:hypothetical protein